MFQYERKYQISNGAFSSVFCIKQRGKRFHTLYAAKYLRANTERAKREVEILLRLQHCDQACCNISPSETDCSVQVINFIEVFHCEYHTILVTEFLPGEAANQGIASKRGFNHWLQNVFLPKFFYLIRKCGPFVTTEISTCWPRVHCAHT